MKKKLFLLPLLSAFVLSGCTFELFGKTFTWFEKDSDTSQKGSGGSGSGGGGSGGGGGGQQQEEEEEEEELDPVDVNDFTIDFSADAVEVDQYVDLDTEMTFTYMGVLYDGVGCYDESNLHVLFMRNKDKNNNKATKLAFFGNKAPFAKPIKEVTVELNNSSGISTNTIYRVVIGNKHVKSAVTSGGVSGTASKEEVVKLKTTSTASDAHYFSVSTNNLYNGQILKVSVKF